MGLFLFFVVVFFCFCLFDVICFCILYFFNDKLKNIKKIVNEHTLLFFKEKSPAAVVYIRVLIICVCVCERAHVCNLMEPFLFLPLIDWGFTLHQ